MSKPTPDAATEPPTTMSQQTAPTPAATFGAVVLGASFEHSGRRYQKIDRAGNARLVEAPDEPTIYLGHGVVVTEIEAPVEGQPLPAPLNPPGTMGWRLRNGDRVRKLLSDGSMTYRVGTFSESFRSRAGGDLLASVLWDGGEHEAGILIERLVVVYDEPFVDLIASVPAEPVTSGTWTARMPVTVTVSHGGPSGVVFALSTYPGERFQIERVMRGTDAEFFTDRLLVSLVTGREKQALCTVAKLIPLLGRGPEPFVASAFGVIRESANPFEAAVSVICNTL